MAGGGEDPRHAASSGVTSKRVIVAFKPSFCSHFQQAAPESLQVTVASYTQHLGHLMDPGLC